MFEKEKKTIQEKKPENKFEDPEEKVKKNLKFFVLF